MDQLLYSRDQAAARLSLSVGTIDMLIARGLLIARKMGNRRVIPHASLVAFSQKKITQLWPKKQKGEKTTRREKPEAKSAVG